MKRILFICILLASVVFLLPGAIEARIKQTTRQITDFVSGAEPEFFRSITPIGTGGALLAGFTSSNTAGLMDAALGVVSANGTVILQRRTGGNLLEEFYQAVPVGTNGVIAVGTSNSFGDNDRAFDFYVVRFDSLGEVMWSRTHGGDHFNVATRIQPAGDGGWFIGGFSSDEDNMRCDFTLVRIDETGNLIWSQLYGSEEHEFLYAMAPTTNNGLLLTGSTHGFDSQYRDAYVVAVDEDGQQLWQQVIGGPYPDYFNDISVAANGDFLFTGITHQSETSEESDLWTLRMAPDGHIVWEATVGGDSWDEGWGIVELDSGNIFCVGSTFDPDYGVMNGYGVLFDPDGNLLATGEFGDLEGYQEYRDVMIWDGNLCLATGYTTTTALGDADILVSVIDALTMNDVSVKENTSIPSDFAITPAWPNPFNSSVSFDVQLPRSQNLRISIYNLLGRQVRELTDARWAAGTHRFTWDAFGHAAGTYLLNITTDQQSVRQRVVLLK